MTNSHFIDLCKLETENLLPLRQRTIESNCSLSYKILVLDYKKNPGHTISTCEAKQNS